MGINTIKFNVLSILLIAMVCLSCQRVISVDIGNAPQLLVIEGNLTDVVGTQTVTLSQSVPYNNSNVFPPVTGAAVAINDPNGIVYKFTESKPGTYTFKKMAGFALNTYLLTVTANGQTYTGSSTMPFPVNLDSLTLVNQVFAGQSVTTVVVNYQDPANTPNQYRFVMSVNGVQVKQVFAANDQYSDGRSVSSMLYEADIPLNSGDKVEVEMQCIDAAIYNYWEALSGQGGNTPADSATPSNPPSNMDNGALGYFSCHTTQSKTIIVR